MKKSSIRKLTLAGLLVAVAVVGSLFSIPVLGSKCSPVQHMVNVLAGVLLGPWYACGMGFAAALIRNLLGLGSLLAFPGSMIGALLCGLLYKLWPKLPVAYVGRMFHHQLRCRSCREVFGRFQQTATHAILSVSKMKTAQLMNL